MDDVEKAKAEILNTIFFDQVKVEEEIEDQNGFAKYLKSQLETAHKVHFLCESVLEKIKDDFIHAGISFYDNFHGGWIDKYIFKLGEPGKAEYPKDIECMMTQYGDHKDSFIPMTSLIIEYRSCDGSCMLHIDIANKKIFYTKNLERSCSEVKDCKPTHIANFTSNCKKGMCTKTGKLTLPDFLSNYEIGLETNDIKELTGNLDIEDKRNRERLCNLLKFFAYQGESEKLSLKYLYCFTPTSVVPAGIIFLNLKEKLPDEYIIFFQTLSNQLFLQLSLGVSIAKAKDNLKKHGAHAAAASIIGRNMSHNIGSHVIYYLSNSFQNSDRNPVNEILEKFIGKCKQETNPDFQRILKDFEGNDKANTFEKFYDNMSTFLNYLQARMDYVALAGTIEPGYGQGMKIKDLMEEFEDNKFLIEGIAQSEDVKAIKIKERKSSFQGLVTVPFGEIGKHAFFSILENIIRNSAKHGHENIKNGKLSLYYFAKEEKNNGCRYIVLDIYDELGTWGEAEEAMQLSKDNEESANYSPLIDKYGSLVHAYMGIKEIKISAAFLRKIPFHEIDSEKYKKNQLLKLVSHNNSLMYKIHLLPYKNLLIVTDGSEGLSSVNDKYGIDQAGIEYLDKENEHIDEYKIAVSKFSLDGLKEETKNKLPNRSFMSSDIPDEEAVTADTIIDIYKNWIEKTYDVNPDGEMIYYKPSDENDTQSIKDKWKGIICVDQCINNCSVRFRAHLESFRHYEEAYNDIKNDKRTIIAEDVSKRSHTLKERLNDTSDENYFEKQIFRLELLESAFSRVLVIDERLFSEYQCYWHDFEINGHNYQIGYGDGVLPVRGDGKTTFNFPHEEFIKIAKWLRSGSKDLSCVSFSCNSKKMTYAKKETSDTECLDENMSKIINDCINLIPLQKLVEHIKFLYEKRKDFYRFYLKNIEICNISTTKENDEISFVNLEGKPLLSIKKNDSEKLLLDWDKKALNKFHFFSLHLGIIDKIREKLSCSESDVIRAFDKFLKNTDFILHTGRGKTLQTNDYPIRFMDFTTLNNWVNGSKWMFVQGLYSIKKQRYK